LREVDDGSTSRARNPWPGDRRPANPQQRITPPQRTGGLPEDYREILLLTRAQGLTIREAAERMGRSLEAAKKLSARALARFGELLDRDGK
jgi:DNA-directed RNA polymerase specialized sigma24 family protein